MKITYERLDDTTFEGPLFHPRMEVAGVIDPRDDRLKTFVTVFEDGKPLKRVEVESE